MLTDEVTTSSIVIADFGLAAESHGKDLTEKWGSPHYFAPEILSRKPYGSD